MVRGIIALLVSACAIQIRSDQKTKSDELPDGVIAFQEKEPIRKLMESHKGDFDGDLFNNLLTRPDLAHLLISEIQIMTKKLQSEFPELIHVTSIGKTW